MNRINLKIFVIILFLSFIVKAGNAQCLKELNLRNNISSLSDTVKVKPFLTEKSPVLAGVLSFAVPGIGLGQVYNEEYIKSIIHSSISIACFLTFYIAATHGAIKLNIVDSGPSKGVGYFIIPALGYLINWTYSIVDAIISANNINKQVKLQKYRSDIMDKIKFGLTLDKNKNLNLKFIFEL